MICPWLFLGLCCFSPSSAASLQKWQAEVRADASAARMMRARDDFHALADAPASEQALRKPSTQKSTSLLESPDLTAELLNKDFEAVTLVTDTLGVQSYSYLLSNPVSYTSSTGLRDGPKDWQHKGTVVLVNAHNSDWGDKAAATGGVFAALVGQGSELSQSVAGHVAGKEYQLTFSACLMEHHPWTKFEVHLTDAQAIAKDTQVHTVAGGPDWEEYMLADDYIWKAYSFVYKASKSTVNFLFKNVGPVDVSLLQQGAHEHVDATIYAGGAGAPPTTKNVVFLDSLDIEHCDDTDVQC